MQDRASAIAVPPRAFVAPILSWGFWRGGFVWGRQKVGGGVSRLSEKRFVPSFATVLRHFIAAQVSSENRSALPGSNPGVWVAKKPATGRVTGFLNSMVPPAGFEPAISTLKGWRPWPLDDGDSGKEYSRLFCRRVYRWQTGKSPHRSRLLFRFSNISICNI